MLEREFWDEEIDYELVYDMLLTNPKASEFDNKKWGYDYDALYLLDYKKEKDYKGPNYNILEIELQDNTTNKFICSRF